MRPKGAPPSWERVLPLERGSHHPAPRAARILSMRCRPENGQSGPSVTEPIPVEASRALTPGRGSSAGTSHADQCPPLFILGMLYRKNRRSPEDDRRRGRTPNRRGGKEQADLHVAPRAQATALQPADGLPLGQTLHRGSSGPSTGTRSSEAGQRREEPLHDNRQASHREVNANLSESKRPLSLSLSDGMTSSAMNDSVMKGLARGDPRLPAMSLSRA